LDFSRLQGNIISIFPGVTPWTPVNKSSRRDGRVTVKLASEETRIENQRHRDKKRSSGFLTGGGCFIASGAIDAPGEGKCQGGNSRNDINFAILDNYIAVYEAN
jgi:hypothetical protein